MSFTDRRQALPDRVRDPTLRAQIEALRAATHRDHELDARDGDRQLER